MLAGHHAGVAAVDRKPGDIARGEFVGEPSDLQAGLDREAADNQRSGMKIAVNRAVIDASEQMTPNMAVAISR